MTATADNLKDRDYTLLIDKSGSMGTEDMPGGRSRWLSAQESTMAISREINKLDPDGITVVPFSADHKRYDNVTPDKVQQVFAENRPAGSTNLAGALGAVLKDFEARLSQGKTKPQGETILVVTDGEPDDREAVKRVIVETANRLPKDEVLGIQFVQIGRDAGAARFLKELDDELVSKYGAKYDIVDTKTMEEIDATADFSQVLLGALND